MAEDKKGTYPRIARSVWFGLRDKLKQKVPGEISASYIADSFGMEPASATANVLPALRTFGLVDDANKPLERAWDWRENDKYEEVCHAIIEEVYPASLRDIYHAPDAPIEGVKAWFARNAKVGDAAASKFATTYLMLLEGDLAKAAAPAQKAKASGNGGQAKAKPAKAAKVLQAATAVERDPAPEARGPASGSTGGAGFAPKLHIDIQIHISPDSSSDQIDRIFESMAKHLKDFRA